MCTQKRLHGTKLPKIRWVGADLRQSPVGTGPVGSGRAPVVELATTGADVRGAGGQMFCSRLGDFSESFFWRREAVVIARLVTTRCSSPAASALAGGRRCARWWRKCTRKSIRETAREAGSPATRTVSIP